MTVIFEGNKPKIPPNFKQKEHEKKPDNKTVSTNKTETSNKTVTTTAANKQRKTPDGVLKNNPFFFRGEISNSENESIAATSQCYV